MLVVVVVLEFEDENDDEDEEDPFPNLDYRPFAKRRSCAIEDRR